MMANVQQGPMTSDPIVAINDGRGRSEIIITRSHNNARVGSRSQVLQIRCSEDANDKGGLVGLGRNDTADEIVRNKITHDEARRLKDVRKSGSNVFTVCCTTKLLCHRKGTKIVPSARSEKMRLHSFFFETP